MAIDQDEILDRLRSTIHAWTDEVTQAHAELSGQIAEARAQLETLATVFGGTIPSAEEAQVHVRHTAALERAVAGAEAEMAELHGRLAALECERETLRRELQRLAGRAAQSEQISQELIEARAQNVLLEEALREKSDQIAARDARLTNAESETHTLRARVAELEDAGATLAQVREELRAERDKLQVELVELREHAALAEPDTTALDDLQARLTERDELILQLESSLRLAAETAQAEFDRRLSDQNAAQGRIAELEGRLTETVTREEHQTALAEAQADANTLRTRLASLEQELAERLREREAAASHIAELETAANANADELRGQLIAAQEALGDAESELEALRPEARIAAEAAAALEDARQEIAKLKEVESELRMEAEALREAAHTPSGKAEDAARIAELESLIAALQAAGHDADETLRRAAGLEGQVSALESQLVAAREGASRAMALERRASELEQALKDRTRQLEDIEARMAEAQKRSDFENEVLRNERETLRASLRTKDTELASRGEALREALAEAAAAAEMPALRAAADAAAQESARLLTELNAREAALRETREAIAQQDTALSEIQRELHALAAERGGAPEEIVAELEEAIAQLEELHRVLAERDGEIAALKTEVEALGTRLNAATQAGDIAEALRGRVQELEAALAVAPRDRSDEVNALTRELDAIQLRLEQTEAVLAEERSRAAELAEEADQLSRHRAALQAQLDSVDTSLPMKLAEAHARTDALQRELEQQRNEAARAREARELAETRLALVDASLPDKLAAAQERIDALESEALMREAAEVDAGRAEMLEAQLAAKDAELTEVRAKLALADPHLRRKLDLAEARIDELEGALEDSDRHADATLEELELRQQLGRELETLRDTHEKLKAETAARDERRLLLESEVVRLKEQLDIIDPDLPGKHAKLKDELEAAREKLETVEKERASLQRKLHEIGPDLPDLYEETIQQNESLRASLVQRDAEIAMLRMQLEGDDDNLGEQQRRIQSAGYDSQNRRRPMGEILVNAGIISQDQLEDALREQAASKQRRLGSILVEKGYIREEMIGQVLATQLKLPFLRLADTIFDPQALSLVTGKQCMQHMLIPVKLHLNELTVAMANPHDLMAIEDIEFATQCTIKPVVATLADITSAIVRVYGVDKSREGAGRR